MKRALRPWVWHSVATLTLLGALGLIAAVSGIIPIRASAGHWGVTRAILQFSKERSVATHTLGMKLPELADPALVLRGAGHYETGCKPCHGSPAFREPVIAHAMLPAPPYLGSSKNAWQPEELFYIVKHGIKFTGMPAWPAPTRDDEIRAVVAFLLKLPELDAPAYEQLVFGYAPATALRAPIEDLQAPAPPIVSTSCTRCHGERGEGRGNAAFPKLAGQNHTYLLNTLRAYAQGRRRSGIMQPLIAPLPARDWEALATHYAQLPALPSDALPFDARIQEAQRGAIERGRAIATRGIRAQGVPSCSDCHDTNATGAAPNPAYPRLAGQYADYLVSQLELFKTQSRGGSPYVHLMHNVASRLKPDQMRDVATYYAHLKPVGVSAP